MFALLQCTNVATETQEANSSLVARSQIVGPKQNIIERGSRTITLFLQQQKQEVKKQAKLTNGQQRARPGFHIHVLHTTMS
jgi:hypothetical protein